MDGGHTGDGDHTATRTVQLDRLPVGQPLGPVAQVLPGRGRGEDERDAGEQLPAGAVEMVRVVVGEQDHVDPAELGRRGGGGRRLGQLAARHEVDAGSVESRVGQEAQATVFEENGGAAEDADGNLVGVHQCLTDRR
ncbi:hypothetical protein GCM10020220_041330 [Nonomuraea rubra]